MKDGVTGVLVKTANESELAAAIEGLLKTPEEARRYGQNGRQKAKSCFSMAAHIERLTQIFESAAEARAMGHVPMQSVGQS